MGINNLVPVKLQPNTPLYDNIAYINNNFQAISDAFNPLQINDGANNRILAGKDSMQDYVLKVAKEGYDAFDADDENLIFNSSQNTFKINKILTGNFLSFNVTTNNTQSQVNGVTTIPHGLTYIPSFLGYVAFSASTYALLPHSKTTISGSTINNWAIQEYNITSDATNIYVVLNVTQTSTGAQTTTYGGQGVKVYILQETAN